MTKEQEWYRCLLDVGYEHKPCTQYCQEMHCDVPYKIKQRGKWKKND